MINQQLHRQPVGVDSTAHRNARIKPLTDWTFSAGLNAIFLTATEFADAARDLPVVFVGAGKDDKGNPVVAPIAVLGMAQNQNLLVQADGSWRMRYVPAMLRAYPFATARVDDERYAVVVDAAYGGLQEQEGEALFDAEGKPTEFLANIQKHLELLEGETQRTRSLCDELVKMDVLREMRFDADLPGGRKHTVDGFFAVDQNRLNALTDEKILELHKNGILGLIHAHWLSLGNMRSMLDWYLAANPAAAAAAPATPGTAAVAANSAA